MIEKTDLLSIGYYGKGIFTGSWKKLRYRIEKYTPEEEGASDELLLTWWLGALSFDNTPDEDKNTFHAAFSDEGLSDITDRLNAIIQTEKL